MDEPERRLHAYETALIEVAAFVDRAHILAGMEAIRDGLAASICDDERTIRHGAIRLLDGAMRRYDPPAVGMHLRTLSVP